MGGGGGHNKNIINVQKLLLAKLRVREKKKKIRRNSANVHNEITTTKHSWQNTHCIFFILREICHVTEMSIFIKIFFNLIGNGAANGLR